MKNIIRYLFLLLHLPYEVGKQYVNTFYTHTHLCIPTLSTHSIKTPFVSHIPKYMWSTNAWMCCLSLNKIHPEFIHVYFRPHDQSLTISSVFKDSQILQKLAGCYLVTSIIFPCESISSTYTQQELKQSSTIFKDIWCQI